ncbi:Protein lethal(2)essential for life [Strongyloides ratti]|uniref:Protein lethal(2)essential for life n=1 Tax=Strongyloides ratti TaxID=34506 RepID=A0A090LS76_STRRB|nr:Protein lethal(2)essential for life [Strongyloides ratti]CEF70453.1 Protein lethal(2)essential for life [Strongyloides ratti]
MADRWMSPFSRDPFFSPFSGMRRFFDEMDRAMMENRYWVNKSLTETHKFAEPCPEVINNDKEFRIKMDVSHFAPNELKVTVKDNFLQVEGKHEEKSDNYGTIQRMFVRKYGLPEGLKEENVTSELSKEGILTVGGSKLAIEADKAKNVPITYK